MMRVLWFTNTPSGASSVLDSNNPSGGWLVSLERHLKKVDSVELHVAFYYNKKVDNFKYNGVHYHPMYIPRDSNKLKMLLGNYRDFIFGPKKTDLKCLTDVVSEVSPDIIHIHGTESDFGLIQKQVTQIPVVISIQGILGVWGKKMYTGVPREVQKRYESIWRKLACMGVSAGDRRWRYLSNREQEICSLTKYFIGRTDFDRHASLAMSPTARYFVGNELLREEFYTRQWEKTSFSDEFVITTTISNGFYKGLETVLEAAILLKRTDFKFKWNVIGVPETSRNAMIIKKWLHKDFADNNVHLLGRKNAAEMIDLLCESDVFCQTAHIENSPNSLCEAMLLGMPIVASYAGGTCSMLEHGKEGYLLQDGDPYCLAGTLMDVACHFEQAHQWGENARKRALLRHDPQRVVNEYIGIYKELTTK